MTSNPLAEIERLVGSILSNVAPFAEGMAGIVSSVETMDPAARKFAAQALRPLVNELAAAVEAVASPLRAAEKRLARLAKGNT